MLPSDTLEIPLENSQSVPKALGLGFQKLAFLLELPHRRGEFTVLQAQLLTSAAVPAEVLQLVKQGEDLNRLLLGPSPLALALLLCRRKPAYKRLACSLGPHRKRLHCLQLVLQRHELLALPLKAFTQDRKVLPAVLELEGLFMQALLLVMQASVCLLQLHQPTLRLRLQFLHGALLPCELRSGSNQLALSLFQVLNALVGVLLLLIKHLLQLVGLQCLLHQLRGHAGHVLLAELELMLDALKPRSHRLKLSRLPAAPLLMLLNARLQALDGARHLLGLLLKLLCLVL
mmetsp:Transcript_95066/g.252488  ORF Transcript_95066/g.252488 Transcript_95066/m.252488 type:complete len:288 (-) Transcript_95066:369-1232(-)